MPASISHAGLMILLLRRYQHQAQKVAQVAQESARLPDRVNALQSRIASLAEQATTLRQQFEGSNAPADLPLSSAAPASPHT